MCSRKRFVMATSVLAELVLGLSAVLPAAAQQPAPSSVKNKTYDVWISASIAGAPYAPFHDCARFSETQVCVDSCGDCGPLAEFPIPALGPKATSFIAKIPCGGTNAVVYGTAFDGTALPQGGNVIGGWSFSVVDGDVAGFAGIENPACTLAARQTNPRPKGK